MQGYQERYEYFLSNHHNNNVAYIQFSKPSISHPLFYQSRSIQGVITKNYLNFVTILSNYRTISKKQIPIIHPSFKQEIDDRMRIATFGIKVGEAPLHSFLNLHIVVL